MPGGCPGWGGDVEASIDYYITLAKNSELFSDSLGFNANIPVCLENSPDILLGWQVCVEFFTEAA